MVAGPPRGPKRSSLCAHCCEAFFLVWVVREGHTNDVKKAAVGTPSVGWSPTVRHVASLLAGVPCEMSSLVGLLSILRLQRQHQLVEGGQRPHPPASVRHGGAKTAAWATASSGCGAGLLKAQAYVVPRGAPSTGWGRGRGVPCVPRRACCALQRSGHPVGRHRVAKETAQGPVHWSRRRASAAALSWASPHHHVSSRPRARAPGGPGAHRTRARLLHEQQPATARGLRAPPCPAPAAFRVHVAGEGGAPPSDGSAAR